MRIEMYKEESDAYINKSLKNILERLELDKLKFRFPKCPNKWLPGANLKWCDS